MTETHLILKSEALTARVISLRGEEALSHPYRFEVVVGADSPEVALEALVGDVATLVSRRADRPERDVFSGLVTLVEQGDPLVGRRFGYRVVLEPRAVVLAPRTRTFSRMRVTDVARLLAEEAGMADDLAVSVDEEALPVHETLSQCDETGLAFLRRVLALDGIDYCFRHRGATERLVIGPSDEPPVAVDYADPRSRTDADAAVRKLFCRAALVDGEVTTTFHLQGAADDLRAGGCIRIAGHFREDYNRTLRVTRVTHVADERGYRHDAEATLPSDDDDRRNAEREGASEDGPSAWQPLVEQRLMSQAADAPAESQTHPACESFCRFDVPYTDAKGKQQTSYLRLGASPPEEEERFGTSRLRLTGDDINGALAHTTGNRVEITEGNREVLIGGANRFIINSGGLGVHDAEPVYFLNFRKLPRGPNRWRKTEAQRVTSDSYSFGDSESFFFGFNFGLTSGLSVSVNLGGSFNLAVASSVSASLNLFNASYDLNLFSYSWSGGCSFSSSEGNIISAEKEIKLTIKGHPEQKLKNQIAAMTVGGIIGGAAGVASAVAAASNEWNTSDGRTIGASFGGGVGIAVGTAGYGALIAKAFADVALQKSATLPGGPELVMNKEGASVKAGTAMAGSRLDVTPDGVFVHTGKDVVLSGKNLVLDFETVSVKGNVAVGGSLTSSTVGAGTNLATGSSELAKVRKGLVDCIRTPARLMKLHAKLDMPAP